MSFSLFFFEGGTSYLFCPPFFIPNLSLYSCLLFFVIEFIIVFVIRISLAADLFLCPTINKGIKKGDKN